ncbi:hypothetical protein [Arthrobacter sp. LFS091]|uniref:hypothetical protein n=1 Tax=Arthrobacter sp. LFS091 TaxID=3229892 RepID=UPI003A8048DB
MDHRLTNQDLSIGKIGDRHASGQEATKNSILKLRQTLGESNKELRQLGSNYQKTIASIDHITDIQVEQVELVKKYRHFDDWGKQFTKNNFREFPQSSADAITKCLDNRLYTTVVHIGGMASAAWTYDLMLRNDNAAERITFAFPDQAALADFEQHIAYRPWSKNVQLTLLDDAPPPAASIGNTLATEVDLMIVDFGCLSHPAQLAERIPSLYWHWLRPEADAIVVDSSRLRPILAAKILLDSREDLVASVGSGNDFHLKIKRAIK